MSQTTDIKWFNQIVRALQDGRQWEIHQMGDLNKNFQCYACGKARPEWEIVMDNGNGEPYWLGSTCVKKVSDAVGYDIRKGHK